MTVNKIYNVVRKQARELVLNSLGAFSVPQPGVHILNGHRTQGENEPQTFRQLLSELAKQVKFVRFEDAVRMITNHEKPQEPLVAFTFDDGFMDCYDYFLPILEEFGVNACLFVNPNYVEGDNEYVQNFNNTAVLTPNKQPMRWNHLKELSDRGHVIAAHTMDHYMINVDDEDILRYQIETCKKVIEDNIDKTCECFAFPYGKLSQANNKAIDIAFKAYKYVFSQSDYKHYFSFDGRVINRRHFEPFWPISHVRYFLSAKKI